MCQRCVPGCLNIHCKASASGLRVASLRKLILMLCHDFTRKLHASSTAIWGSGRRMGRAPSPAGVLRATTLPCRLLSRFCLACCYHQSSWQPERTHVGSWRSAPSLDHASCPFRDGQDLLVGAAAAVDCGAAAPAGWRRPPHTVWRPPAAAPPVSARLVLQWHAACPKRAVNPSAVRWTCLQRRMAANFSDLPPMTVTLVQGY